MTVEDLRPELEDLLRSGHIELYEMTDPGNRLLSLADALGVIADDRTGSRLNRATDNHTRMGECPGVARERPVPWR